jgi:hypothetical protein
VTGYGSASTHQERSSLPSPRDNGFRATGATPGHAAAAAAALHVKVRGRAPLSHRWVSVAERSALPESSELAAGV